MNSDAKNDPKAIVIFELMHELEQSERYLQTLRKEIEHVKTVIKYTRLSLKAGKRVYPDA